MAGVHIRRYFSGPQRFALQVNSLPFLNVSALLKQYGLHADKRLGQNFLQDTAALERIVATAEIQTTDTVLEIGAGLGSLTRYLAESAHQVIAVELDAKLMPALMAVLEPYSNVSLIQGDILSLAIPDLDLTDDYLVAANIPYNITSAIIRHLLESKPKPRRVVLTLQKEVAERICAAPPDMSLLALSVQVYGKPMIAAGISAGSFFPVPKVDSAVVKIEIYPEPLVPAPLLPAFFKLIKAGFGQKRKTLRNSLSAGLGIATTEAESLLANATIDSRRRAETLSLDEWRQIIMSVRGVAP
jgi:16S rRNA (adenine1518-N6/adenine1519-N6)-dimethyltransferase